MKRNFLYLFLLALFAVVYIISRREVPQAELLRPSVVKPVSKAPVPKTPYSTNIILRAVETPSSETEQDAEKLPVSEAVRCVIGAEESSANRYIVRSRALEALGEDLSADETRVLLDYLASTDDPLRPERVAALKNDIMNVLRSQRVISPDLAPVLIQIFNAKRHESVIFDYCIQHLGALQQQLDDPTQLEDIRRCIRSASLLAQESYSGTALIALTQLGNPTEEDCTFLRARTTTIVEDSNAHEAARISAMQIASENGYLESRPAIRRVAESSTEAIANRTVAIGALGVFGDATDIPLLQKIRATDPNPRFLPALNTALERIEKRAQ